MNRRKPNIRDNSRSPSGVTTFHLRGAIPLARGDLQSHFRDGPLHFETGPPGLDCQLQSSKWRDTRYAPPWLAVRHREVDVGFLGPPSSYAVGSSPPRLDWRLLIADCGLRMHDPPWFPVRNAEVDVGVLGPPGKDSVGSTPPRDVGWQVIKERKNYTNKRRSIVDSLCEEKKFSRGKCFETPSFSLIANWIEDCRVL